MYRKTYVEVDVKKVRNNIKNIIKKYNEYEYYIAVVKGNAYGHGMEIVKYLKDTGINYFAVSSLEEALEVRKYDEVTPVLCLEPIDIEYLDLCVSNNVAITVHSYEYFKQLVVAKFSGKVKVHLKLDTGINRLGIKDKKEVVEIYNALNDIPNIELEGIYSHFGTLGIWDKIWDNQKRKFYELTEGIDLSRIKIVHFARSQSIVNHKKIQGTNGVRLGISMYGYVNTFTNKATSVREKLRLCKRKMIREKSNISECVFDDIPEVTCAIKLKSNIIQIKEVKKGETIGYGAVADKDMLVATVPIGYADGFDVRNVGRNVEINGKLYRIVGTVNMCMISVCVDNSVKTGDEVILVGGKIDPEYVAQHLGVNRYIVITTIAKELPRVYIESEE